MAESSVPGADKTPFQRVVDDLTDGCGCACHTGTGYNAACSHCIVPESSVPGAVGERPELRTEAARELFDHTERLGYSAYDAARELMEERGGGDWAEALALVEQEAIALSGGAVGERPACPLCGAPVEVTAMTYGFPKVTFSGGAVGEREEPLDLDKIAAALGGFLWLGNNLHNSGTETFREMYGSAMVDARPVYNEIVARLSVNEGEVAPVEPQEPR